MARNTADEILTSLLPEWHKLLQGWSADGSLVAAAQEALILEGEPTVLRDLVTRWAACDFTDLPPIVLLSSADINGALGAYALSTRTTYLNADWLQGESRHLVFAVLTEELGHYLDRLLNEVDTPGDEGEYFAAQLCGEGMISAQHRELLLSKSDQGIVVVNEVSVSVEQATVTSTPDPAPTFPTITNIDLPRVSLSGPSPSTVTEDGTGEMMFSFFLLSPTASALTVNYTVAGSATIGRDYTGIATTPGIKTVTFEAGRNTATVWVKPIADSTSEPDETVELALAAGSGYSVLPNFPSTGTIIDDDLSSITLAVAPASVAEDGTANLLYTFSRTGITTNPLTVNYTVSGTATLGSDYTGVSATGTTKSVTFAAASSTAIVTVDPIADSVFEADETIVLQLAGGTGYISGTTTAVTGTITNDDFPIITLAVTPAAAAEDGTNNLVFTFSRSGATTNPLTVNYSLAGSATLGTDYTGISPMGTQKTLTFEAGSATATVTADPSTDSVIESDETVILTVAAGTGYTIGINTQVSGTISNDDYDIQVVRVKGIQNSYVFEGKATTLDVFFSDGSEKRFFWHVVQSGTPYHEALRKWINENGFPKINSEPTDLTVSTVSFDENIAAGSTIGILGTTDPDSGDTFSYALVSGTGTGSTDNAAFSIAANQLKINTSPDFESKSSYSIRIRSTDAAGLSFEKVVALNVNDLPEQVAPPQGSTNTPSTTGNNSPATSVSNGSGTTIINNITNINTINNINSNNTTTNNFNNSINIAGSFNGNTSAQALAGSLKLEDPDTKKALPVSGDSAIKTLAQLTTAKPLSDTAKQLLDRYIIKDPSSSSSRKASADDAGFIDFTLKTGSLKSLTAEIALASEVKATAYVKVNPNTGEAYDFTYDPVTGLGAELLDTNKNGLVDSLRIHLQDGGLGDVDGAVNGSIRDPGVLAEAPRTPVYRFYRNGVHFYTTSDAERDNVIKQSYGSNTSYSDLSANPQAKDPITGGWGYKYEGVAYQALDTQGTALYRFFSPSKGYHFVTTNAKEALAVIQNSVGSSYDLSNAQGQKLLDKGWGFQFEGNSYKVSTIAQTGMDNPVFRFFNATKGVHFYSSSMVEAKSVITNSLGASYATDSWISSTSDAIKAGNSSTPAPLANGWGYSFEGIAWYV